MQTVTSRQQKQICDAYFRNDRQLLPAATVCDGCYKALVVIKPEPNCTFLAGPKINKQQKNTSCMYIYRCTCVYYTIVHPVWSVIRDNSQCEELHIKIILKWLEDETDQKGPCHFLCMVEQQMLAATL